MNINRLNTPGGLKQKYIEDINRRLNIPQGSCREVAPHLTGGKTGLLIQNFRFVINDPRNITNIHRTIDPNGEITKYFGWIEFDVQGPEISRSEFRTMGLKFQEFYEASKSQQKTRDMLRAIRNMEQRPMEDYCLPQHFHVDRIAEWTPKWSYFYLPKYASNSGADNKPRNVELAIADGASMDRAYTIEILGMLLDENTPDRVFGDKTVTEVLKKFFREVNCAAASIPSGRLQMRKNRIRHALFLQKLERHILDIMRPWVNDHNNPVPLSRIHGNMLKKDPNLFVTRPYQTNHVIVVDNDRIDGMHHGGIPRSALTSSISNKHILQFNSDR